MLLLLLLLQVERLLDSVDAAIYLLDYTKLKTAEEAAVLARLKAINPALVARLSCRLFFAVNKMDQAGEGQGLDEEETKDYVAQLVTRQLDCPGFSLHPDQVGVERDEVGYGGGFFWCGFRLYAGWVGVLRGGGGVTRQLGCLGFSLHPDRWGFRGKGHACEGGELASVLGVGLGYMLVGRERWLWGQSGRNGRELEGRGGASFAGSLGQVDDNGSLATIWYGGIVCVIVWCAVRRRGWHTIPWGFLNTQSR